MGLLGLCFIFSDCFHKNALILEDYRGSKILKDRIVLNVKGSFKMVQKNIYEVLNQKFLGKQRLLMGFFVIVGFVFLLSDGSFVYADEKVKEPVKEPELIELQVSTVKVPKLCYGLAKGVREYKVEKHPTCGFPLPSGDKDFSLPKWEVVDNEENFHIIEQMFLWGNYNYIFWNTGYEHELFEEAVKAGKFPDDIEEKFLKPVRKILRNRSDEIILERAYINININQKPEAVYRMTSVKWHVTVKRKKIEKDEEHQYSKAQIKMGFVDIDTNILQFSPKSLCHYKGLPGEKRTHFLYFDPRESPDIFYLLLSGNGGERVDYFLWRGKAILSKFGFAYFHVLRTSYNPVLADQICTFSGETYK